MDTYTHIIIPLLIFVARIIDVSLGTIRMLLTAKGKKAFAAGLGFIEVLIWLLAIKEILNNLTSIAAYVAYPAGFAAGTYIGMLLEEKLISGKVVLRVIVKKKKGKIKEAFEKENIQFTIVDAEGSKGASKLIFCIIDRKKAEHIINIIKKNNPKAFYSVENIKYARDPISHQVKQQKKRRGKFLFYRKGK